MKKLLTLLVLLALMLSLFGCGKKKSEQPETEMLPAEGISALTYYNSTTTLRFTKTDNVWVWTDGVDFPLDETTVKAIVDALPSLLTLTGTQAGEDLTEYGLAAPSRYLTVSSDEGTTTFYFGSQTDNGTWYMRTEDASTVYQVEDAFVQLLNRNIYDMAVLPTLPDWTEDTVKSVSVTVDGASPVTIVRKDDTWLSNGADITEKAASLLDDLRQIALLRCVDYAPADDAATICGLTEPVATITVKYENAVKAESSFTIVLGDVLQDNTSCYATLGESDAIYAVEIEQINAILSLAGGHM